MEKMIQIPEWQFKHIENALRLTHRINKCASKETAFDREVVKAYQFATEALANAPTSGNSLHKHFVNGSACATHKIKQLPYLQWHEWAESLDKKGIKQVQCDKCKRWLFPEEI